MLLAGFGFQVLHQPLKRRLIRVVVLPVAEVGDEVLAYLARRVKAQVGVEQLPILHLLKRRQRDGKQELLVFPLLARTGVGNFGFDPVAAHAGLGEDEQQPVMQANGLVNLLVQLAASLDVVWREPAADAFGLQVGMEPLGKPLVFGGVADEAGVKLYGPRN